jgi:hypothetical protein
MNASAFETQTLYTTSLEISSNALVNQSNTPDIMTSFVITTPQLNISVFDTCDVKLILEKFKENSELFVSVCKLDCG